MKACAYFKQLQLYFESVSPQINRIVYTLGEEISYLQFTILNCSAILGIIFYKIYRIEYKSFTLIICIYFC